MLPLFQLLMDIPSVVTPPLWVDKPDAVTNWNDTADESTNWTDKADESTTWTDI